MRFFYALFLALSALVVVANGQETRTPVTVSIKYHIEGKRSASCSGVPIGPNLVLSCDHAVRSDKSSLGKVLAVNRRWDWALIETDKPYKTWSPLRTTRLTPGETVYFNGGTAQFQENGYLVVRTGRIIHGMSGGPIWDSRGRVVSVISENELNSPYTLFGYQGVADWVGDVLADRNEGTKQSNTGPSLEQLQAALAALSGVESPVETSRDHASDELGRSGATSRPTEEQGTATGQPRPGNSGNDRTLPDTRGSPPSVQDDVQRIRDLLAGYRGVRYYEPGNRPTTPNHLSRTHGWPIEPLFSLSQNELDRLHGASHTGRLNPSMLRRSMAEILNSVPGVGKGYWKQVCRNGRCEHIWVSLE